MPAMECQRRNWVERDPQKMSGAVTTLAMLFSWAIPAYAAGEICQVQYDVTYGQTEARTMLAMINDFRTGGDAWYWMRVIPIRHR